MNEMQTAIERLQGLAESDQARIAPRINEYLSRLDSLRAAIREGLESGPAVPFDADAIIQRGRSRLATAAEA